MERPNTISGLCVILFGMLGAAFTILGLLFWVMAVPIRGGPSWAFLPVGLLAWLLCLAFSAASRRREARRARLRAEGVAVPGEILSVDRLAWINWNPSTLWNWPGGHSPWRLRCAYRYGGERYQVKSDLLWREPVRSGWRPTVYLDPGNPRRAVVDLDTVPLTL